ncbi:hypothetical protein UlMin_028471 [Ulmus minor]
MDLFQSKSQKQPSKYNKKRLSHDQVKLLERSFTYNKKLEPERKQELANQLGVPPRKVAIWYQNKRARWRTQTLEMDCNALQLKLQHAMAEKKQLEKDLERLRGELDKAREMMFVMQNQNCPPPVCTISSCCDQVGEGGSSFPEDLKHDQVLQIDELYACLHDWQ